LRRALLLVPLAVFAQSGWRLTPQSQSLGYTSEVRREGVVLTPPAKPAAPGFLMQSLDAAPYRGQAIRLSAAVRLESPGPGERAQLFLRVGRAGDEPAFYDDMGDRPIVSSAGQTYEIQGEVAADAVSVEIGLELTGASRAWIGAVSLETVPGTADAATRQALTAVYARLDAAYAAGNPGAIAALAMPDAVVVIAGERTPLAAILQQVDANMRKRARYDSHSSITAVRAAGSEAVVSVNNQTTVTSAAGSQTAASVSRDTWTRTAAGWRLKESVLIATHLAAPSTGPEVARAVAAELRQRAVPLPAGIAAIGAAAGGARIVALGQASYGTREFAELNFRTIQELVEHHGFTVVAIGANWAEARAIDDYLRTGQGSPAAAIETLDAWPWETVELLELVRWVRDWNAAPGHMPVRFAGFDVQPSPAADRLVLDYLKKYAPEDEGPAALVYAEVRDPERAVSGAAAIARGLDVKHRELVAASSAELWRDARQAAANAWQSRRGPAFRSEAMAANVVWLASEPYPAAKIVLWTHNANVSAAAGAMGSWLRRRYGQQLFTVGYVFRGGEVRAVENDDVTVHAVTPSPQGSGDSVLGAAAIPEFFLDMRRLPAESPLGRWLGEPHLFHQVGAVWGDPPIPLAPGRLYDALIYVETSTPTRELP
jgi:erythromycin esterase